MNAGELKGMLAGRAEEVVEHLLPNARKRGREMTVGSVDGEEGSSLSICVKGGKAGVWSDFSGDEGGDLLDLWCSVRRLSLLEAIVEAKRFLGVRDDMPTREAKAYARPERPQCQAAKAGVLDWLQGRGLTAETIAAFRIAEQPRGDKTYAVFPFLRDGDLINVKYRNIAEKKDMRQEGGAEPCLFGWHLVGPRARSIAICEGEIDAMTLHQVGLGALSVNAGAGNHQWLENDWDRLAQFEEIFLCFDSDEAGQKGMRELANRLGCERVRIVTLGAKDANQWLQDGATPDQFHQAFHDAKTLDPDELRPISDFTNEVIASFYPAEDGPREPRLRLDQDFDWFEFRRGEVSLWTGINGHGKSLLLSQTQLGLMAQGERFVVFSGEMLAWRLLKRTIKQATGLDRPAVGYIRAVSEWLRDMYWVFNLVGTAKLDRLLEVFTYAHRRYGCTHFVIDSLMTLDIPDDGPKANTLQKEAIAKLCAFARQYNVHVHLVAHPRKGRDESSAPGKLDVAGSGHLTNGVDNVFAVWRATKDEAKPDESGDPDARLELQKQRNGEVQNYKLALWFDRASQQYRSQSRRYPLSFVTYSNPTQSKAQEYQC